MQDLVTYEKLGSHGRLGNQLFQIASTIGLAEKSKLKYGFPEWEYQSYFVNPLPKLKEGAHFSYTGYLQDYRYFENCKDLIKFYFTLKPTSFQTIENTIFIHFRAYSSECVEQLHPEQTTTYYKKAIQHFPDKNFVVFTDDIEKAMKVVDIDCPYIKGTTMNDFYYMSHCDGGIIANSSYSWWAAWLTGGKVVAPNTWYAGKYLKYNIEGLYLPEWIRL